MRLNIDIVEDVLYNNGKITIDNETINKVSSCYNFLKEFANGRIIYGINTGFGPMAQWRISDENLNDLQYNIIRSHSTGAGNPLPIDCVRAALIARLGTIIQGKSGIHTDAMDLIVALINNEITPYVPEHGSVGASGDLVQLAHMALCLIGEGEAYYKGKLTSAKECMSECGITPLKMHIREGLSLTNGTSFMTGIGMVNLIDTYKLIRHAVIASVMMNEIASSYDDFMSEVINEVRHHPGQKEIAESLRKISEGGKRMLSREHELYEKKRTEDVFEHKVQPYYSLRCVPQILGPILDTVRYAQGVLEDELNSACDNPIVDPDTQNVYHGGNFHGDYISIEMDKVKMAVTKMTMLVERQMNYLFHDRINGILPPFVNMGVLGLNYGLQASQFTACSTTAECQTLSMPMYVHSIPNNNDNQDIVSMGTNSAMLCHRVIENSYQVMSIHFMAIVQAIDCLKISDQLSPVTLKVYNEVRKIFPVFTDDKPRYKDIENITKYLKKALDFKIECLDSRFRTK